jgi:hypothetical protein
MRIFTCRSTFLYGQILVFVHKSLQLSNEAWRAGSVLKGTHAASLGRTYRARPVPHIPLAEVTDILDFNQIYCTCTKYYLFIKD